MSSEAQSLSLRDRLYVATVSVLGAGLVYLLGRTWRSTEYHFERVERLHAEGRPAIFAFWHGVLLPLTFVCRRRDIQVLTSLHRDGEIISRVIEALGFGAVRGSSSRGSVGALLHMVKKAGEGLDLAVTPDGPRGPAKTVKRGVFYLSEKSGAKLVPLGVAASRAKRLSSWDSFLVPLPFSRVAIVHGEPLEWDESAPFEEKVAVLSAALERLNAEAEELVSA
jgi:lysophospholipid acyltransferase (LPLAT)-like uncharacterized protein